MPYCCLARISSSSRCDKVPRPEIFPGSWYKTASAQKRTDDITLLQMESIQVRERAFRVADLFEHDVRGASRLGCISYPDLADSTIPSKQLVKILS